MSEETIQYAKPSSLEVFPFTRQPIIIYKNTTNPSNTKTQDEYEALSDEEKATYTLSDTSIRRDGRVLSEENIALLISRLTDCRDFVISDTLKPDATTYSLEFILGGRYFKLTEMSNDLNIFADSSDSLWVTLVLSNNSSPSGYSTVEGVSNDGLFKGLKFCRSDSTPTEAGEWFKLLNADNTIPITSQYRFEARAIKSINGGTI